jgi:hypothetical protein
MSERHERTLLNVAEMLLNILAIVAVTTILQSIEILERLRFNTETQRLEVAVDVE